MRAYERLLQYVKIHTTSDPEAQSEPSTERQFDLARLLAGEMTELGISDVRVDEHCYVYGTIPASPGMEDKTSLGFLAHLDTSPSSCGENVQPVIHADYDGEDVRLNDRVVISTKLFPHLKELKGKTLITTDGTTLLGADDKAGIAEIMTMAERILSSDRPHGRICLAFTPDEEIGGGASHLDIPAFGARYAYTVDGCGENEIEYETFNAAAAVFEIHGRNVHPGDAKDRMINAALLAAKLNTYLPAAETPSQTEGREGFFHMTGISGDVEHAKVSYIVRDHSTSHFEARKEMLRQIEKRLNEIYGEGTVILTIREQYRNMAEMIRPCIHLVENAQEAIRELGLEPKTHPVRGGTDGSQLSFRGLPCPNLGTGGYAFHGPYEHITVEGMDFVTEVLLRIIYKYAGE